MNTTDIFVHIHKSGGTSLMNLLDSNYPKSLIYAIDGTRYKDSMKDLLDLTQDERSKFRLIKGHMFFGVHNAILSRPAYFSMVREPLSRLISLYNYLYEIQLYPKMIREEMDFVNFLHSGIALTADNGMTRFISGVDISEVPYGKSESWMLEKAIENIEKYFLVVGLTERFDESLILFRQKLNWKHIPFYTKENVTQLKKLEKNMLGTAELHEAEQYLYLDRKLYNYISDKFEKELKEQPPQFFKEVELLKAYVSSGAQYKNLKVNKTTPSSQGNFIRKVIGKFKRTVNNFLRSNP